MLRGAKTLLRARQHDDVPLLQAELYDDVPVRVQGDSRPWRPVPAGGDSSPFAVPAPAAEVAHFSVVELASGELAGAALLWGIDQHNRIAHLGLALRPAWRGRGLGSDAVEVLCHYGFTVLGLHRLQLETLAENTAMVQAGARSGFVLEGRLRRAGWVYGEFRDEVIMGLLAEEWQDGRLGQ
ncbi:GNAT family N-acetyltransferase [Kitasatospora sp. RB6PN24]|uniref:GNAT family N-acetyltransferase n=1 Tax=Kitasatospora humi TaxID=2893891 RepID=UPI001E53E79C|nr:GNAT family protein [Kitasatospora humi]MCC9306297.1 GNAT family N-acetyltransferase [Kitasatospora humi]